MTYTKNKELAPVDYEKQYVVVIEKRIFNNFFAQVFIQVWDQVLVVLGFASFFSSFGFLYFIY